MFFILKSHHQSISADIFFFQFLPDFFQNIWRNRKKNEYLNILLEHFYSSLGYFTKLHLASRPMHASPDVCRLGFLNFFFRSFSRAPQPKTSPTRRVGPYTTRVCRRKSKTIIYHKLLLLSCTLRAVRFYDHRVGAAIRFFHFISFVRARIFLPCGHRLQSGVLCSGWK